MKLSPLESKAKFKSSSFEGLDSFKPFCTGTVSDVYTTSDVTVGLI